MVLGRRGTLRRYQPCNTLDTYLPLSFPILPGYLPYPTHGGKNIPPYLVYLPTNSILISYSCPTLPNTIMLSYCNWADMTYDRNDSRPKRLRAEITHLVKYIRPTLSIRPKLHKPKRPRAETGQKLQLQL